LHQLLPNLSVGRGMVMRIFFVCLCPAGLPCLVGDLPLQYSARMSYMNAMEFLVGALVWLGSPNPCCRLLIQYFSRQPSRSLMLFVVLLIQYFSRQPSHSEECRKAVIIMLFTVDMTQSTHVKISTYLCRMWQLTHGVGF